MLLPGQPALVVTEQVVPLQHAPVGSHGIGEHVLLKPMNELPATQLATFVSVHRPVVLLQQAPWHGLGVHVLPVP